MKRFYSRIKSSPKRLQTKLMVNYQEKLALQQIFEEQATVILQEIRKQRRSLQMEFVAKVTLQTT